MNRYLMPFIQEDLKERMVFLGGPRQVGKTTLSLQLLGTDDPDHEAYFNWDQVKSRSKILAGELPSKQGLIIFDEIHKYSQWRNLIKGHFDQYKKKYQFLITGSARLDYYQRGGDSLQGRYHYYRLHPLSLFEINPNPTQRDLETLLAFGGFPEPFFKGSKKHWQRWQNERQARVIHEDLLNLERVREISQLDLLQSLLPARAGSILSINSIKEDLSANHESVERWIQIFENLYVCYRIPPFLDSKIRSAKKEKKLYLWDWSLLESPGGRFENLVASNLLKYCHLKNDADGEKFDLSFFRDSEKREIDFIVSNNKKPIFAVECKTGDRNIADNIKHFSSRLQIPQYYQVHLGSRDYVNAQYKVRVMPFLEFSKFLGI